ncbi:uncharacterized protein LOC119940682 [Tachyglossus aculeatus]|uniref:uncharacterized protein LOC119940682 n=1 Tax=Tachyglossus aculeatus TaxID=9261 RepID=UPI0018F52F87|nr:uncharacterized protein LOC119940682 [Tachyglossus aculeatus]
MQGQVWPFVLSPKKCGLALKPSLFFLRSFHSSHRLQASRKVGMSATETGTPHVACRLQGRWRCQPGEGEEGQAERCQLHPRVFAFILSHYLRGTNGIKALGLWDSETGFKESGDVSRGWVRRAMQRDASCTQETSSPHIACKLQGKWRCQPGVGEEGQAERCQLHPRPQPPCCPALEFIACLRPSVLLWNSSPARRQPPQDTPASSSLGTSAKTTPAPPPACPLEPPAVFNLLHCPFSLLPPFHLPPTRDTHTHFQTPAHELSQLCLKLLQLEQECELLRNTDRLSESEVGSSVPQLVTTSDNNLGHPAASVLKFLKQHCIYTCLLSDFGEHQAPMPSSSKQSPRGQRSRPLVVPEQRPQTPAVLLWNSSPACLPAATPGHACFIIPRHLNQDNSSPSPRVPPGASSCP